MIVNVICDCPFENWPRFRSAPICGFLKPPAHHVIGVPFLVHLNSIATNVTPPDTLHSDTLESGIIIFAAAYF